MEAIIYRIFLRSLNHVVLNLKYFVSFFLILAIFSACNRELTSNADPVNAEQEKPEAFEKESSLPGGDDYDQAKLDQLKEMDNKNNFKEYFEKGLAAHNAGEFKSAVKFFTMSIESYSEYADAWGFRGMSKFKADDARGACSDWKHAMELGYSPASQLYEQNCR